jgi:cell division initiation protein
LIVKEVRCMKVTPLEIRQQQFPLRFRGFDPTAVDTFLELLAGEIEILIQENARLRQELMRKDQEIQQIREEEGDWKKALMAVQQTTEDLIGRGERQAQLVVVEAERKAQEMLIEAKKARQAIAQDVQALTGQRRQLVLQLRSLLVQHLKLVEAQGGECEEKRPEVSQRLLADASDTLKDPGMLERAGGTTGDRIDNGAGRKSRRRSAPAAKRESVSLPAGPPESAHGWPSPEPQHGA